MIRRARHYLETDESSLSTAMHDREKRNRRSGIAWVFCGRRERARLWQRGLRFISGTTRLVLRSFATVVSLIRPFDSFVSRFVFPHPSLIARAFAHVSFFFPSRSIRFNPPRKVKFKSAPR